MTLATLTVLSVLASGVGTLAVGADADVQVDAVAMNENLDPGNVSLVHRGNSVRGDGSGLNSTKLVSVAADRALTFDNGTNYGYVLTNADSGQSVNLTVDGSIEVGANNGTFFTAYRADGSPDPDPTLFDLGSREEVPLDVAGSIPAASGLTNFTVALRNATTGQELASTAEKPYVVGYRGVLAQNATAGQVRLSIPGDAVPTDATATVELFSGGLGEGRVLNATMGYDATTDEFETVVDAGSFDPGNYSWAVRFHTLGALVLQVGSPGSANENVTFEGDSVFEDGGVSIQQNNRFVKGSGELNRTKVVAVEANRSLSLDNGTNFEFRLTDEDAGESVTLAFDGSFDVPAGEGIGLLTYDPQGEPKASPQIWPEPADPLPARVMNGTVPDADPLTNFSVALLNASSGGVLAESETAPALLGYTGSLAQNSTTGQVRLSMPRDVAPENAGVTVGLARNFSTGTEFQTTLSYDPGTDEFAAVVNASSFAPGDYGWEATFRQDGVRIVALRGAASDNPNVTFGDADPVPEAVSIQQVHGGSTSDNDRNVSKIVTIQANTTLSVDNGTNFEFRLTNEDAGESVTLAANGSAEVPPGDSVGLRVYDGDGSPAPPRRAIAFQPFSATVTNGSVPPASGLTNFSVDLLNASSGEVLAETGTAPAVVGYEGLLTQNSTTGTVRLSLPADAIPADADATLRLAENRTAPPFFDTPMAFDAGTGEFAATVDASAFEPGDYSWNVRFRRNGDSILNVPGHGTANPNVTLQGSASGGNGARFANVTGRLFEADGDPAAADLVAATDASFNVTNTDADGNFGVRVLAGESYSLGFVQRNESAGHVADRDGVADLFEFATVETTADVDLGNVTVPAGHVLNVTVEDPDGDPVEGANVAVEHHAPGSTRDPVGLQTGTNAAGLLQFGDVPPGIEVTGNVSVEVDPPANATRFVDETVVRNVTVSADRDLTVQLAERPVVAVESANATVGNATAVNVTLSDAPDGLSAYNVTVSVTNGSVADVATASVPGSLSPTAVRFGPDDDSVTLAAADPDDDVTAGATGVRLATLELSGDAAGASDLRVAVHRVEDDAGGTTGVRTADGTVSVSKPTLSATGDTVEPGQNATVAFELTNTAADPQAFILNVSQLPDGFAVVNQSSDGGTWKPSETKWLWQTVEPGESRRPSVTVSVPDDADGTFAVAAEALTADGVAASTSTTVTTCRSVDDGVDANDDGRIGDVEILTAIEHWRTDEPVDGTCGKTVGDFQVLSLVEDWRSNSVIDS